ncbi:hypothetical protein DL765_009221 [Monosporascus sp. GIB2]|nr:hypothetical protein DL765_009221 [Monosporascus sp. GIB2]
MGGQKWAVLIGADVYEEVTVEHTSKHDIKGMPIEYETLHGAVLDVLEMREHLIQYMGVAECRIRTLLTRPWDDEPAVEQDEPFPSDGTPTFSEIVQALAWVLESAEKDDLVYFHFSGHGAQATTVYPSLKGEKGLDEALVPIDANNGGKYLRDIEMALWLKKMVAKGLVVTVVLDSCHSGSATRGSGRVRFRGVVQTYKSTAEDYPTPGFMAELVAHNIGTAGEVAHKGSVVKEHWLLEPREYTLLAACLPRQAAREYEDTHSNKSHGALTYCLLDTLRKSPLAVSSTRNLYRRVCARIQSLYCDQTPVIGGTTDRAFFGNDILDAMHHVLVHKVDPGPQAEGHKLELSGGTLHGVQKGSEYSIYSFTDRDMEATLARVEVKQVSSHHSVATFIEVAEPNKIEPGCKAILSTIPAEEQFRVCISSKVPPDDAKAFVKAWENVPSRKRAWMQLVTEDSSLHLTFRVDMSDSGYFEIQDGDGVALPNLEPPLPKLSPRKPHWPEMLVYRLRHLTLFNMVKKLENLDGTSTMRCAFRFEVIGRSRDGTNNTSPSNIAQVEERNGEFVTKHGGKLFLRVQNKWSKEVFFSIFNLRPLFGVKQIYPSGGDCEPLDADSERILPLTTEVPRDSEWPSPSCLDTFKIFVTPKSTSLGNLELLDLHTSGFRGSAANLLQIVLDGLRYPYRNGAISDDVDEWGTEEIAIRTFK